jgi:protein subunit release factor A
MNLRGYNMIEKLATLEKRYNEIEEKLSDVNVISDMEAYKNIRRSTNRLLDC